MKLWQVHYNSVPYNNAYDAYMAVPSTSATNNNLYGQEISGENVISVPALTENASSFNYNNTNAENLQVLSELERYKAELQSIKDDNFNLKQNVVRLQSEIEQSKYIALEPSPQIVQYSTPAETYDRLCKFNNIVIYNVLESPYFADNVVVSDIFRRLGLSSIPVLETYRTMEPQHFIGPRPIVVRLANLKDKIHVLNTRKELHGIFPWIKIGMDLTQCQKQQLRALQHERIAREAVGETGHQIKFVNGNFILTNGGRPRRNRRIQE